MRRRKLGLALLAVFAGRGGAQISPGPLARAHQGLEGSAQCLKCHDSNGVAPARCLACHTLLGERLTAGKGLHAQATHGDCKRCHMEHQGREFELVFWGEPGRRAFDHAQAGFVLRGKHSRLSCDDCHRGRQRRTSQQLTSAGAGPGTLLGLPTGCAGCHADEHRGQFSGRDCAACHWQETWKPAAGFDHARSAFRLDGRHRDLACEKCHPAASDAGKPYRRYTKVPFSQCSSCHRDPHENRFGPACARCHDSSSWRPQKLSGFDHERTSYPLRGRHRALDCSACHRGGQSYKLPHARCSDCHADVHRGQLASRQDGGRCESCHDVGGFSPARYGPLEHSRTRYALQGAHLAVPCDGCHRREVRAGVGSTRVGAAPLVPVRPGPSLRLDLAATRCADCHKDVHQGEADKHVRSGGCEACHAVEAWRQVRFDHNGTRFALEGGHARLACGKCHDRLEPGTPRQRPRLSGLAVTCEGCHEDPHQAQFVRPGQASACERCHTTSDWSPTRFDHARDSTFALDGAHVRLGCRLCHRPESRDGKSFVRYRPLRAACKDCHGASPPPAREGKP